MAATKQRHQLAAIVLEPGRRDQLDRGLLLRQRRSSALVVGARRVRKCGRVRFAGKSCWSPGCDISGSIVAATVATAARPSLGPGRAAAAASFPTRPPRPRSWRHTGSLERLHPHPGLRNLPGRERRVTTGKGQPSPSSGTFPLQSPRPSPAPHVCGLKVKGDEFGISRQILNP